MRCTSGFVAALARVGALAALIAWVGPARAQSQQSSGSAGGKNPAEIAVTLRVTAGERDTVLSLVPVRGAPMVDAGALASFVGGSATSAKPGTWVLGIGGVKAEVTAGMRVLRVDTTAWPLSIAPAIVGGRLMLPLQVAAEHLPRIASGFSYDASSVTLHAPAPAKPSAPAATRAADPPTPPAPTKPARRPVVVIDPGHGGPKPGMLGRLRNRTTVAEKDVTLGIALKLAPLLRELGYDVVMTRTTDVDVPLRERGRIANQAQGDLFISIHVNSAGVAWRNRTEARGLETYFLSEARTEDERRVQDMENEVVRDQDVGDSFNGALEFILNDMAQNQYLRESAELAETVQRVLASRHPGPDRGVKQAEFAVLAYSYMPAVLIETGFGSNPDEMAWLTSGAGQSRLANDIARATHEYFQGYQRRVGDADR